MVDALRDAWRVLARRGVLLDLRPRPGAYALELVTPDGAEPVGLTDTTGRAQDDAAADAAVERVLRSGLFALGSRVEFAVAIVWDTVRDLQRFMATRESTRVTPSYEELEVACRKASRRHRAGTELRASRRITLAAYEAQNHFPRPSVKSSIVNR